VDPIKIAIFLAVFGLLLLIGRLLARASEVHASQLPPPQPGADPIGQGSAGLSDGRRGPALTGAEVGLPGNIPAVKRLEDGGFNRPYLSNYYFAKTDLVRGPADSTSFCDELFLLLEDPETQQRWYNKYTVATPAGLRQLMDQQKFESVYLEADVVIVSRWDLELIMRTVIDELVETYSNHNAQGEVLTEPGAVREDLG